MSNDYQAPGRHGSAIHPRPPRIPADAPTTLLPPSLVGRNCRTCGAPLVTWTEAMVRLCAACPAPPKPRISSEIIAAIMQQAERIDRELYCDITIKVQDGKPVLVEITTKHKPGDRDGATCT